MLRFLLAIVAFAISTPTLAQTAPPATVRVAVETSEGRFVIELERAKAPVTTANFLRYVDQKRLDGTVFYRSVKVQERFGFVQFGVQNARARILPPIKHEPTSQTGLKHLDGTISIARLAPGTAQGEFTISVGDQPSLDAGSGQPEDNLGYAAFGRVVEGMEVIHKILDAPTSPGGTFPGQMIAQPVKILTARRVPVPAPAPAPAN